MRVPMTAWVLTGVLLGGAANARGFAQVANADEAGLIHLDVSVMDSAGRPVSGLSAKDFTLLDNGQPQAIRTFEGFGQPDPTVEVILLLDTLKLSTAQETQERMFIEAFLRQDGGHLVHPVSIFHLGDLGLGVVARYSRDGNELAREMERDKEVMLHSAMPRSNGGIRDLQAIPDGPAMTGMKALASIVAEARRRPGRKLLLWVGPGPGIGTGTFVLGGGDRLLDTADWFSTALREARIALYTLSTVENDPKPLFYRSFLDGARTARQAQPMHLYKSVLAEQSGGRSIDLGTAFVPLTMGKHSTLDSQLPDPGSDLVKQMDRCVQEGSDVYTLSFDPPPAGHFDEYHELKVQVDQAGLTARTNTGYYDQPYYTDQPDPVVRRLTVAQLETVLIADHGKSDAAVARELEEFALTEQLSSAKVSAWMAEFRGEKTRQALLGLADSSAFLDPPPTEIPGDAAPETAAQQQMLAKATEYLSASIPKLPNTFATRTVLRYADALQPVGSEAHLEYHPLQRVDSTKAMVVYRQGKEVVDAGKADRKLKSGEAVLSVNGTFGPLLSVAADILAVPEDLHWSRWGEGPAGRVAVFRYEIPAGKLSYRVWGCCLPDGDGTGRFRTPATYRGEIAIDPVSGSLLRLDLEAGLKSTTPQVRSDVMIEYGPVEIAGKTYICPRRSVSISRVRSVNFDKLWDEGFLTYGPYLTLMNDMEFGDYHVFRTNAKIRWDQSGTPAP